MDSAQLIDDTVELGLYRVQESVERDQRTSCGWILGCEPLVVGLEEVAKTQAVNGRDLVKIKLREPGVDGPELVGEVLELGHEVVDGHWEEQPVPEVVGHRKSVAAVAAVPRGEVSSEIQSRHVLCVVALWCGSRSATCTTKTR